MTRVLGRVYCNRAKGAHILATVTDKGVDLTPAAASKSGVVAAEEQRFTRDSVAGLTSLVVQAACKCGHVYEIDVAALLRGETLTRPLRVSPQFGALLKRKRGEHGIE